MIFLRLMPLHMKRVMIKALAWGALSLPPAGVKQSIVNMTNVTFNKQKYLLQRGGQMEEEA